VKGDERLRLFCALRLPDESVRWIAAWQADALRGVERPVRAEHLHVTLAFLGSRPRADLAGVVDELRAAAAAAQPPELVLTGYRETRSVGMLTFDDVGGAATAFATDLHRRLERLGVYRPESRTWLAHVTVLRFRRPPRLRPALPSPPAVRPSEAAVYLSVLRPSGAQYEVLESVPLGG
jgi:2'-5' RNA ligase